MKKGNEYSYNKICKFVEDNDYGMEELGKGILGENFLIVRTEGVETITFVLAGYGELGYIYECIYSDL